MDPPSMDMHEQTNKKACNIICKIKIAFNIIILLDNTPTKYKLMYLNHQLLHGSNKSKICWTETTIRADKRIKSGPLVELYSGK